MPEGLVEQLAMQAASIIINPVVVNEVLNFMAWGFREMIALKDSTGIIPQ